MFRLKMSVRWTCFILTVWVVFPGTLSAGNPWLGDHHSIVSDDWNQEKPVVVYDSVDREYLVIWEEEIDQVFRILGRRVDEFGNPVGSPFRISTSDTTKHQRAPEAAYDPYNNHYFVVWEFMYSSGDEDIYGAFIPGGQSSPSFVPLSIDSTTNYNWEPTVAFNPSTVEFLVVYPDLDDEVLKSCFIDATDQTVGAVTAITGPADLGFDPDLTWNQPHSQYLLSYTNDINSNGHLDVYALRLDTYGGTIGSEMQIEMDVLDADIAPSAVASCRGISIVFNWKWDPDLFDTVIEATRVFYDGTLDPLGVVGHSDVFSSLDVACSEYGREFFAVWGHRFDVAGDISYGIQGIFIDIRGEVSPVFSVYWPNDGRWRINPALAYGDGGKALTSWQENRNATKDNYADIHGRPAGNRIFADGFEFGADKYWIPSP